MIFLNNSIPLQYYSLASPQFHIISALCLLRHAIAYRVNSLLILFMSGQVVPIQSSSFSARLMKSRSHSYANPIRTNRVRSHLRLRLSVRPSQFDSFAFPLRSHQFCSSAYRFKTCLIVAYPFLSASKQFNSAPQPTYQKYPPKRNDLSRSCATDRYHSAHHNQATQSPPEDVRHVNT